MAVVVVERMVVSVAAFALITLVVIVVVVVVAVVVVVVIAIVIVMAVCYQSLYILHMSIERSIYTTELSAVYITEKAKR